MAKLTPAMITKLAAERRDLMAQIDELTKRKKLIDEKLLSADKSKTYTGNDVEVSYTPIHTLDSDIITKKFPADEHPDYYKLALDTVEFKKHFSPKQLEEFQKVSYRIKVVDL